MLTDLPELIKTVKDHLLQTSLSALSDTVKSESGSPFLCSISCFLGVCSCLENKSFNKEEEEEEKLTNLVRIFVPDVLVYTLLHRFFFVIYSNILITNISKKISKMLKNYGKNVDSNKNKKYF